MVVLSASNENLIYCIDLSNFWGTLQSPGAIRAVIYGKCQEKR